MYGFTGVCYGHVEEEDEEKLLVCWSVPVASHVIQAINK